MKLVDGFSQIKIVELRPGLLRVHVRQNCFVAGEIDLDERIFYSVPRSKKNLMYVYSGGEGALGINEEILLLDSFDIIKVKYNEQILTTSRRKWLSKGVLSRYCDLTVDRQVVLKFSDVCMENVELFEPDVSQTNLFEEVAIG